MNNISPEQKATLRKIKQPSIQVKNLVYQGCLDGPMMASQFNTDVRTYGLWEALLYVERYEAQGKYTPGTASKAVNAALFPGEEDSDYIKQL